MKTVNVRGLHLYEPINVFKLEPNAIVKLTLGRRENEEVVIEMPQQGKTLREGSKLKLRV